MINGRWIFVPSFPIFQISVTKQCCDLHLPWHQEWQSFVFPHALYIFLSVNKRWKNIPKIRSCPTKKVRPAMCHVICLWDNNTLQSSVTGDVSDPAGDYSSLWPEQSDFFSSFSLPFLYSWRHRIILPILEWLQQRHCYSQGAVSPRCNSIHSQLDWPVIYRKSSPSE